MGDIQPALNSTGKRRNENENDDIAEPPPGPSAALPTGISRRVEPETSIAVPLAGHQPGHRADRFEVLTDCLAQQPSEPLPESTLWEWFEL